MKRLMVTGASGFLGWNLCSAAKDGWQVTGICKSHIIPVSPITALSLDLCDFIGVEKLFKTIRPDAVVHAAAAADPNFCQRHPDRTRQINVDAPEHIAGICSEYGAACVFISSDLVFDGKNPPYSEESPANPTGMYGEQKTEAEKRIRKVNQDALICRMPLMFGDAPSHVRNHCTGLIDNIIQGNETGLFIDEFRSMVSGYDAAKGILRFIGTLHGVINLGGKKAVSRFDFGKAVANALGVTSPRIKPCLQKDVVMPAPRPANVSLDSTKAFSLGYDPDGLGEALGKLECIKKKRMKAER